MARPFVNCKSRYEIVKTDKNYLVFYNVSCPTSEVVIIHGRCEGSQINGILTMQNHG